MKKSLLYFLVFLPVLASAQNVKGPYVGVTTQYQSTRILNDKQYDNVNYQHTVATQWAPYGVTLGYKFNENHNVQVELISSNQGETWDFIDLDGNKSGEKHLKLEYWNIPLLFKYTTAGKLRFNFQMGPQISILKEGYEENVFFRTAKYRRDKTDLTIAQGTYPLATFKDSERTGDMGNFNKHDLGILFGLGLEYSIIPNLYLSANLRSHYNFVNVRAEEHISVPQDPDYYVLRQNLVIGGQAGLHFLFNTGDGFSRAKHQ